MPFFKFIRAIHSDFYYLLSSVVIIGCDLLGKSSTVFELIHAKFCKLKSKGYCQDLN